jgi:hypothetical protein
VKPIEIRFINHGRQQIWLRWYDGPLGAARTLNENAALRACPDAREIEARPHTEHVPNASGHCSLCGEKTQ